MGFSYENKDDYLYIKVSGERKSLLEIFEGTAKLHYVAQQMHASLILADYRKVHFNVNMTEAFNLVRLYENKFPDFGKMSVATVVNTENLEIAKFWEAICIKRGFNNKAFLHIGEAEKWLKKQNTLSQK